jgi:L-malate glycosyltransferase
MACNIRLSIFMLKVHYYSDCPFFAGCENMLANFFNSEGFRQAHSLSFSYRQSAMYTKGFKRRVEYKFPVYPVTFPDLSDLTILHNGLPPLSKSIIMAFLRFLFTFPVLIYEILILYRQFKKLSPDILHINNGGYPAALSARAAAIAGKLAGVSRVIMVVNNMAVGYQRFSRWLDYPVDCLVSRQVDLFVTGSEAAATNLKLVLSLPNNKVMAIHNGIAIRSRSASKQETRARLGLKDFGGVIFGVVALLIPRKGHQVLLDSLLMQIKEKRLKDDSFKIMIEGSGPLRQNLVDFVNSKDLTRYVIFVGDEDNIVDFISALDVLILPSVQDEDFPNVILEAMALGKPVIASRLAGTPEQIVNGETGLLVEPRNIEQLGKAICHFVDNPSALGKMGYAGLCRFSNSFTCHIALDNYTKIYTKLLEI